MKGKEFGLVSYLVGTTHAWRVHFMSEAEVRREHRGQDEQIRIKDGSREGMSPV